MGAGRHNKRTDGNKPARSLPDNSLSTQEKNELAFPVLTARSKTSRSPREGTRPTRFRRKSTCIVGPVPSPGGFFNRLPSDVGNKIGRIWHRVQAEQRLAGFVSDVRTCA